MNRTNIFPYIFDYLSILFEDEEIKKSVRRIILFGSVARGDFDRKSDVDIFVDVPETSRGKIEKLVRKAEKRFYSISSRKWELMGVEFPISSIIGDLNAPRWKELKNDIIASGITLYGKYEELPKGLEHYVLFNYSLSPLTQNRKMKLLRRLFGYAIRKGKTVYRQMGVLEKIGGKKLSSNTILIPAEKAREIQKFFTSFGVTPEMKEVWTR
ncbi:MAG: nucleotidyltransferase domain-containing protein [Candidatus Aenigmarchaeota archaeon]|nr:nucleotidyltransferase domain-containing protein [Candidatus Aenigmarchaeota archaeon]